MKSTSAGAYEFSTVQGGNSYTISAVNPGFEPVGPAEVTLTLDRDATDVNFTLKKTEEFSNLEVAVLAIFGAGAGSLLSMILYAACKAAFKNWRSRLSTQAGAREAVEEIPMEDVVNSAREVGGLSDSRSLESLLERTSSKTVSELEPIDQDVLSTSVSESEFSAGVQDAVEGVRSTTSFSDFVNALNRLDRAAYRCAVQTLSEDLDRVEDLANELLEAEAVENVGDMAPEAISGIFAESGYTLQAASDLVEAGGFAIDAEVLAEATGIAEADGAAALLEMILDVALIEAVA